MISMKEVPIQSSDAIMLISELNQRLLQITGDDGTSNFHAEDVDHDKSVFLIAYLDGIPYGCGALRKLSENTAEIKRVYARKNKVGIGRAIVGKLEERAKEFGYHKLLLETRKQNIHAIQFYSSCGYINCSAYGPYIGKENAYCFEKDLI